jgi:chromate reductase
MPLKVLAFDGSGRADSMNRKLLAEAAATLKGRGAEVTIINLHDFDLPIYDGDLESASGLPDSAKKLKTLFNGHDAFLIASPEYNGSVSGLLKNAIDWVSRQQEGEGPLPGLRGKVAGIMSAAPGKMGGLRGLYQLNTLLFGLGVLVLPEIVSIGFYKEAFDANGKLKNDPDKKAVETLAARLITVARAVA